MSQGNLTHYLPGQSLRLSVEVTSLAVDIDPTTITLSVKDPVGNVTVYSTPTHDGVGLYHQDIALPSNAAAGTWVYKWVTTGAPVAQNGVVFASFDVDAIWF